MFHNIKLGTLEYAVADTLEGTAHCFTTRYGGVSEGYLSSLNLGVHRGDVYENVVKNYEILGSAVGFRPEQTVFTRQRHTDIIPTECGCERQIGLWQKLERWEENDNYMPLPGDYIYYAWDEHFSFGDCTGWADHVGIVVGTNGPFIKVIEGNRDDMVTYRIILRGNWQIRGYGLPDYASK